MTPPSVYIETSVISYLTARPSRDVILLGQQVFTARWWETDRLAYRCFVSEPVLAECAMGDPDAARRRLQAIEAISILPNSDQVARLTAVYLAEGLVPPKMRYDAVHLAMASAHGIDYLVTWNCRHLATPRARRMIAGINQREGFSIPALTTPMELAGE